MAGIDNNIQISVSGNSPPVAASSFGLCLYIAAAGTLDDEEFTERVRSYEDAESAAADDDLTEDAQSAVDACFSQPLHISRCQIGRVEIDVAQVHTLVIDTAADGVWTIPITLFDGTVISPSFTASGSAAASAIATGLRSAITTAVNVAHNGTPSDLTPSGSGANVVITADTAGNGFTVGTVTKPAGGAVTSTATTPNRNITDGLDAILAEDPSFYAFTIASKNATQIKRAAQWAEANKKVFVAQTSDAAVYTSADDDIASQLKALSYAYTGVMYHPTDSEFAAWSWMCFVLQCDPDEKTTMWAYHTLAGVTPNTLGSGPLAYLEGKNCNYYSTLKKTGATYPGKVASGLFLDQRLTRDWFKARLEEAFAQFLLDLGNANKKPPYTDKGRQAVAAVAKGIAVRGENAGHIDPERPYSVTMPAFKDIPPDDKANRIARLSMVVYEAGAIQKLTLDLYVSL